MNNIIKQIENGDPKAVADLLNRAIGETSPLFKTAKRGETLGVLIESESVPELPSHLPLLKIVFILLENSPVRTVKVYGRQSGCRDAAWVKSFHLKPPSPPPASQSHPAIKKTAPSPSPGKPDLSSDENRTQRPESGFIKQSPYSQSIGMLCFLYLLIIDAMLFPLTDAATKMPPIAKPALPVLENTISLQAKPPHEEQTHAKKEKIPPVYDRRPLTIKAVGDIIPGTNYPARRLPEHPETLFEAVAPGLWDADIVFGNFESTLTTYSRPAKNIRRANVFAFRTPPGYAHLLSDAGFTVLNLANNHSMDFFQTGFRDTLRHIEASGMLAVGRKNEIAYCHIREQTIAFISFSTYEHHNMIQDMETAESLIWEAGREADIIVISIHAGAEGSGAIRVKDRTEYYLGENRGNIIRFARMAVDAGADLILGHGPHVLRGMALYKGKLIAYSLGNFIGYRTLSTAGRLSYSMILEAELDQDGYFIRGQAIPVILNRQGIPCFDSKHHGRKLVARLMKSDFPESPLTIDEKGRLTAGPLPALASRINVRK